MPQRYRTPRDTPPIRWGRWLGAFGVLLLALGAYAAWSAFQVRDDLQAAQKSAGVVQSALLRGDQSAADRAMQQFTQQADAARGRADGPLWRIGEILPFVGDDATAVRLVARAAADVGEEARRTLFSGGEADLLHQLTPHNSRVDVAAVRRLEPTVSSLDGTLTSASTSLSDVRPDDLSSWVRPSYQHFADRLGTLQRAMAQADKAMPVLPEVLGADKPRTYLLRFNTNAEIRASGGMPGAWALVRADRGRISMVRQGSAGDFPEFPAPVLPLTEAEKKIYDVQPSVYFQDTGFIPDFPRNADLVHAMWDQRFPDQHIDGVLEVDTVTLAYLLKATGPIQVTGGPALTSANAVSELLNGTYQRIPDPAQQNVYFAAVADAVFKKLTAGGGSPSELLSALGSAANEGRVHVHLFDPALQKQISGTAVAGQMDFSQSRNAQIGIYLNDATGSKMSYYLRSTMKTQAASCAQGVQTLHTSAIFSEQDIDPSKLNDSITGPGEFGTPKGEQLVLVRIYGPVGGTFGPFSFDGKDTPVDLVTDRGRPVAVTVVQLKPGQTVHVEWTTKTARGQAGDATQQLTPDLTPKPYTTTIPTACG